MLRIRAEREEAPGEGEGAQGEEGEDGKAPGEGGGAQGEEGEDGKAPGEGGGAQGEEGEEGKAPGEGGGIQGDTITEDIHSSTTRSTPPQHRLKKLKKPRPRVELLRRRARP